mgnify:CR=1 FL=1
MTISASMQCCPIKKTSATGRQKDVAPDDREAFGQTNTASQPLLRRRSDTLLRANNNGDNDDDDDDDDDD